MNLTFTSYEIRSDRIELLMTVTNPEPGAPATYTVRVSDAELQGATTNSQLRALVAQKLNRQIQADAVASRLGPLVGATFTV
jgi:hypothetical protein